MSVEVLERLLSDAIGDLHGEISSRSDSAEMSCLDCSKSIGEKSKYVVCRGCYFKRRRKVVKEVCIEYLGGKCTSCSSSFVHRAMDFRTTKDHKTLVAFIIKGSTPKTIAEEVSKCELLCSNCNRIGDSESDIEYTHHLEDLRDTITSATLTLEEKLQIVLTALSEKFHSVGRSAAETSDEICTVDGCSRSVMVKPYCGAHYHRYKRNISFDKPIRNNYRNGSICLDCKDDRKVVSKWSRCVSCYEKLRRRVVKLVCVMHLGNKCSECLETFPVELYDFHHLRDKTISVGRLLSNKAAMTIASEVDKCALICSNCHRAEHSD